MYFAYAQMSNVQKICKEKGIILSLNKKSYWNYFYWFAKELKKKKNLKNKLKFQLEKKQKAGKISKIEENKVVIYNAFNIEDLSLNLFFLKQNIQQTKRKTTEKMMQIGLKRIFGCPNGLIKSIYFLQKKS